jgi:exosortase
MSWRKSVAVLTALALVGCYAPTLRGMFEQWRTDEDMSHGFLVPVIVLWIVWRERERWRTLPVQPTWWGLVLLASAAAMQFVAALGVGLFAGSLAFLVSIAGAVLCLGGFNWLRALAFPLALSVFMLPKLALVYNQTTLPMQLLASRIAAGLLTTAGIGVIREGNILDVGGHRVEVVEACNGIRYLLSLGFMAVVLGYVFDSKPGMWVMRVALLVDFDGVNAAVAVFITVLRDGVLERLMHLAQAVLQDFAETDQDRQRDAPELEIVHQFLEVDGAADILLRVDLQVTVLADGEVPLAPTRHVVEFCGLRGSPTVGGLANSAIRKSGGGGHETSVSTDLVSGASEKWQPWMVGCVYTNIRLTRYWTTATPASCDNLGDDCVT